VRAGWVRAFLFCASAPVVVTGPFKNFFQSKDFIIIIKKNLFPAK
jgi:hypothetical protein